jgi:ankyrin repeat protein
LLLSELIPKVPYGLPKAHDFMTSVKMGLLKKVQALLKENPFLVHTYDNLRETGLHWAAKRNLYDIGVLLIKNGIYVNSKDIAGRTALYVSWQSNHEQMSTLLILEKANAYAKSNWGKFPINVAKSEKVQRMLRRVMLIELMTKYVPFGKREEIWEKVALKFFKKML